MDPRIAEQFYRLRLRLLEARARYRSDGGREGVAEALSAVLDFLDTFEVEGETPDSDLASALQPLRALTIALRHPGPHPMFAPQKKPGRPERTHEWAALQALAAVAASHLIDADREKEEACSHVANRLSGRRQPGKNQKPITWETVEKWRDQAREGNPANDRITALYREYLSLPGLANGKTPEAMADELIAVALEMLPPAR
jgi:hypothetical protein